MTLRPVHEQDGTLDALSGDARATIVPFVGAPALRPGIASSQRFKEVWLSPERRPASKPSTLTCWSRSSQWMPWPPPMRRQLRRSCGRQCSRRGYQPSGTAIVRPSLSSAVRVVAHLDQDGVWDLQLNPGNSHARPPPTARPVVHRGLHHQGVPPAAAFTAEPRSCKCPHQRPSQLVTIRR